MDRFFCPTLSDGTTVTLADEEFHHLVHVLRAKPGQHVELFDGKGGAAEAVIDRVSRRDAQLSRVGELTRQPEPVVSLVLGVACPKGDRLKWLVEKATELGVAELIPLNCERSVVEPRETKLARLEQTVLSACKQCRRNRLMRIGETRPLSGFLEERSGAAWIAHPGGKPVRQLLEKSGPFKSGSAESGPEQPSGKLEIRVAIGPEGGFTESEVSLASASGVEPVSLGAHVLRVETAALALAAVVLAWESAG